MARSDKSIELLAIHKIVDLRYKNGGSFHRFPIKKIVIFHRFPIKKIVISHGFPIKNGGSVHRFL